MPRQQILGGSGGGVGTSSSTSGWLSVHFVYTAVGIMSC